VDYISIQPRMNRAAWTATVTKMKEKYGAPISSDQIQPVVDYLARTYGAERPSDGKK
jgi:sulfite dehydrogenase (cytochrome) subunit B